MNTSQNNSATINQLLKPDLGHRLLTDPRNDTANADAYDLNTAIFQMALRAQNVISLIQGEFCKDLDDDSRPNNDVIYFSLETVWREVEDMRCTVEAFSRMAHTDETKVLEASRHKKTD